MPPGLCCRGPGNPRQPLRPVHWRPITCDKQYCTSPVTDLDGSTEELVRQKLDGEDFYKTTKEIYIHFIIALPIFALLTNSLSLFVFIMRGKKEQTVNMLLIALTISDMLSLVNVIDVAYYYQVNWSLQQRTRAGCKLIQYVTNVARDCSSWLILTFTIDRFVAVWFPLKRSSIMTKRRVQLLMLGDVVLACASEINTVILFDYLKEPNYCGATDIDFSAIYTTAFRNTIGFLVPSSVVAVLNGLIIHRMQKYQAKRSSMMSEKESSNKGQNRSLTIMLVTTSTCSILCYLPRCIFFFYLQFGDGERSLWDWSWGHYVECLALLNYGFNFFFYCLSGSQFRKDLKDVFRKLCNKGRISCSQNFCR